jgi:phosphoglycolate phosphatase-like HAD superfamily hydrolase
MDVPTSSCLMVGDTQVDIITGKKAGAQTVGVLCGFGDKNELERAGADLILDNTADLMGYLLNNNGS